MEKIKLKTNNTIFEAGQKAERFNALDWKEQIGRQRQKLTQTDLKIFINRKNILQILLLIVVYINLKN